MEILLYLGIFVLGLIIGSFLNCVIFRIEREESFIRGRSKCMHCGHELSWQDLIPVVSFLFLGGKCRYCKQSLSLQYPLVELSTAILFLAIFKLQPPVFNEFSVFNIIILIYLLAEASLFIIIFVYDLKYYLIPDGVVFAGISLALIYDVFMVWNFGDWNLARILGFGFSLSPAIFFLLLFLFSRGKWIGFGDIKLAIFMGLFLGWPKIIAALFLGVFLGAIIGIGLIILGKKKISNEIPFGPFLITGTFAALFWGSQIVNWYLKVIT